VIRDVAALLEAIQQKEIEAIRRSGITHAPTVGAQYEGVTSSILKIMVPAELELQVVSGFVEGVDGTLSGQIDCMPAPGDAQMDSLPFHKVALYRMLLDDHVAPVRIILGYGGFKTEDSLRQGFLRFLERNAYKHGFAGSSLPSLIVCANNSILKTNGQPYYLHPWRGRYLCYASSAHSPILWILNLILTRISHHYTWRNWYNRDLSIDRFTPLLWGKASGDGRKPGWEYWEHAVSAKDLKEVSPLTAEEWQPAKISQDQAVLLASVGNDGIAKQDIFDVMEAINLTQEKTVALIDDLVPKDYSGGMEILWFS